MFMATKKMTQEQIEKYSLKGAKVKYVLRAGRIGPEILVARFLLISIYFVFAAKASGSFRFSGEVR